MYDRRCLFTTKKKPHLFYGRRCLFTISSGCTLMNGCIACCIQSPPRIAFLPPVHFSLKEPHGGHGKSCSSTSRICNRLSTLTLLAVRPPEAPEPVQLIVLPGRRLIMLSVDKSAAATVTDDCELELDFRDFLRRHSYRLTLRELLNLISVSRCVQTQLTNGQISSNFSAVIVTGAMRLKSWSRQYSYSINRKRNKRVSHCERD
jgi:hypothetical protein